MFGDIGHGFVLFLAGAIMCLLNDFLMKRNPALQAFLQLRYIALLMGIFATFCGLIYNDFVGIPIWIWDSCYDMIEIPHDPTHGHRLLAQTNSTASFQDVDAISEHHRIPKRAIFKEDCTYPLGIDPVWHLGSNELAFLNSLKMKLSVILAVLQMGMGVCMKAFNACYFGNRVDFFFEFVPQIILLFVLFGYMDVIIICKWLTDFTNVEYKAPSVIGTMIEMALNGGSIPEGQVAVVGPESF